MSGEHAVLAPSSAEIWVPCPGSIRQSAPYPDEGDTQDTLEGSASHWAGSEMLAGRMVTVGATAPNGVVLNDEMFEGAVVYVAAVLKRLAETGQPLSALHVEERVAIPRVHRQNWGTPDVWLYAPNLHVLDAWDYKFGHRFVDEFENWQLIDYVAGIMDVIGINGLTDQTLTVNLHVVQPRCYQAKGIVRTWTVNGAALRAPINILATSAAEALGDNPTLRPGQHCTYCRGRHSCAALQQDAYRSAQISRVSLPVDLPPDALGLELHFLRGAMERLKARVTGLEAQAESLLRAGKSVPYSTLETVDGNLKWTQPDPVIEQLGKAYAKQLTKTSVITPAQAINAGIPADVVTAFSSRTSSLKLKPDDGRQARKVFGNG